MNQRYYIGVDISKHKVDIAVINTNYELVKESLVVNNDMKLEKYFISFLKKHCIELQDVLVCCETTGIYCSPLKRVCHKLGIGLWVEHAVKIKRASTDMRGKSDRKDAVRIAEYACRYQDKVVLYQAPNSVVTALEHQVKVRESLIDKKVSLENHLREAKTHDKELYKSLKHAYNSVLRSLMLQIKKAEERIETLASEDQQIKQNIGLLRSIPGIGTQNALQFIIRTNNFNNFSSAKHLACYAGVVPFVNESGTIVRKPRVSHMANLNLKKLLHLAAMAAIRMKGEIRDYYLRKVAQGKNKMSVLNAIRNKLVHRIYAIIERQTPYDPLKNASNKSEALLVS